MNYRDDLKKNDYPRLNDGVLPPVCAHFASYITDVEGSFDEDLYALAMSIVYASCKSHVCYDPEVDLFSDEEWIAEDPDIADEVTVLIERSGKGAARALSGAFNSISNGDFTTPLVISGGLFYLNKYRRYEEDIARFVHDRSGDEEGWNLQLFEQKAQLLFPGNEHNEQRNAAKVSVQKRFSIISGGPGTGKTTTVCRVILLRIVQALNRGDELSMLLAAPTGKAASRLKQSIQQGIGQLREVASQDTLLNEGIGRIPLETGTIHRSLVSLRGDEVLPYDLIILDEASMIDLFLFHTMISRCGEHTSLILLGDSSQLASVQAGSVLSDLIRSGPASCSFLNRSFRFSKDGGIGRAADLIINSQGEELYDFLKSGDPSVSCIEYGEYGGSVLTLLREGIARISSSIEEYSAYSREMDDATAVSLFLNNALLCVTRGGRGGVEQVNSRIESLLAEKGAVYPGGALYQNMPLMISRNNYLLRVYNGDSGLVRSVDGRLRLCILDQQEMTVHSINPSMLESYEKSYAMTIHKSQGSEFNGVVVILPEKPHPLLSRELIYTGVTRAREKVCIITSKESLLYGVSRGTERMSGLSWMIEQQKES